jgi:hypothetical protein
VLCPVFRGGFDTHEFHELRFEDEQFGDLFHDDRIAGLHILGGVVFSISWAGREM